MKFWKFEAPGDDQIGHLLALGGLPPRVSVPGLLNTYDQVAGKLKKGDGLVLATLKGEEGKITAFGKVRGIGTATNEPVISWARGSHGVLPTGSGLDHWRSKTSFEISAQPAQRYGLGRFIEHYLKDSS